MISRLHITKPFKRLEIVGKAHLRSIDPLPKKVSPSTIRNYCSRQNPPKDNPQGTQSQGFQSTLRKYNRHLITGLAVLSGSVAYVILSNNNQNNEDKPKVNLEIKSETSPVILEPEKIVAPNEVPYLIIGAGTAAFAAFRSIRANDPRAKVLVIGDEDFYPYMRPALSKELWFVKDPDVSQKLTFKQWNGKDRSIFFEPEEFYCSPAELMSKQNGGVAVLRSQKAIKIDPEDQLVFLENGHSIKYDKCLIATGGRPKSIPIFENASSDVKSKVSLFRTVKDFQQIDEIIRKKKSITVIGGGFLGSELACAFGRSGKDTQFVTYQVFPEAGNMGKVLPDYLSKWTTEKVRNEGVTIVPSVNLKEVKSKGNQVSLLLSNGEEILTDHVVLAVGLEPNTDLAKVSGLETDNTLGGFLVNAELEARKNLWVAGDVSSFFDVKLGRRRVEHHDHAVVSGRLAGENMTGAHKSYAHQSMFWSDLGPYVGYEAIGIVDAALPTVGVFAKVSENDIPKPDSEATEDKMAIVPNFSTDTLRSPNMEDDFGRGVLFYLKNNIVVGIVLWNVFNRMSVARKIINESKEYEDLSEVAKLFNLHSEEE